MEPRGTNSIWNTMKCHDWQTSTLSTRLHQTVLPSHRRISIWRGSHTLIGRRVQQLKYHSKTQTTPSHLLLCHLHWNRMQLWHLWLGTPSNHESHHPLVAIPNLDKGTLHHTHRPHKPATLEITEEIK
jgi:hypothetical protein